MRADEEPDARSQRPATSSVEQPTLQFASPPTVKLPQPPADRRFEPSWRLAGTPDSGPSPPGFRWSPLSTGPEEPPHPLDRQLLETLEGWFARVSGPDRRIDAEEIGRVLGIRSDLIANRVLSAFDGDRDGWMSRDDFLHGVRRLVFGSRRDKLVFAFRLHDLDNDGFLQSPELVRMIALGLAEDHVAVGDGEPERLASVLLREADHNRDGRLSFGEFEAAVSRHPDVLEQVTRSGVQWIALNEDVLARREAPQTRRARLRRLLQNRTGAVVLVTAWAMANAALFAYGVHTYAARNANEFVQVARGAGACLNFNGALILVPMMRRLLTHVRRTPVVRALPVDHAVEFHRLVGNAMFAFAVVHTGAHVLNYSINPRVTVAGQLLTTKVGLSGLVLLVVFTVMWVFSRPSVRRRCRFELFYVTHLLYFGWFALALVHGPAFWMWATAPLVGFAVEQALRRTRRARRTEIFAGHALRSGVTRLEIRRPAGFRNRAGDYLFLRIPEIARHEWHPFTISSAPERDRLTVHVRALGDWTSALRSLVEQRYAQRRNEPLIAHVDGPHGAPATGIFESRHAVLIGAGIGVTPFASVLESIVTRAYSHTAESLPLRKAHFFWLNRDQYSFEWFSELLAGIEQIDRRRLVEMHIFMTGGRGDAAAAVMNLARSVARTASHPDLVTGLRAHTQMGHPDWARELENIARRYAPEPVDVYFCGPPGLGRQLRRVCSGLGLPFRQERF